MEGKQMISRALALVTFSLVAGCYSHYLNQNFEVGTAKVATVGSEMLSVEGGEKGGVYDQVAGIRQSLYYGGIDHNVIQVSYREFDLSDKGSYARSSFNQELKYDLGQSDTITFRSLKIKVHKADQAMINFTVIEWGNAPKPGDHQAVQRK